MLTMRLPLSFVRNYRGSPGATETDSKYDAVGKLVETIDPAQNVTKMDYDIRGNRTWMSDPNMGDWTYTYNALGELKKQKDPRDYEVTIEYDALGRMTERTSALVGASQSETTATWEYYDVTAQTTEFAWLGALRSSKLVDGAGHLQHRQLHYYDPLGRPETILSRVDQKWYYTVTKYDALSRPRHLYHYWKPGHEDDDEEAPGVQPPQGWESFRQTQHYNARGSVSKITDQFNHVWWEEGTYDSHGRIRGFDFAGSLAQTDRTYHPQTGALTAIQTIHTTGTLQHLGFAFDRVGNLTGRWQQWAGGLSETFTYDALNRLHTSQVSGQALQNVTYDAIGNIQTKTGVGSYVYSGINAGPHAVTGAGDYSYTYDANGNRASQSKAGSPESWTYSWTSANLPKRLTRQQAGLPDDWLEFTYDANHGRITQVNHASEQFYRQKKIYVGGLLEQEEKETFNGQSFQWELRQTRIFIQTPVGIIGSWTKAPGGETARDYFLKDHLGSITAVCRFAPAATGTAMELTLVEEYDFGPWGERRDAATWGDLASAPASYATDRGYTGHEMLAMAGLVHMNGRLYDPVIGRMISADPFVPEPGDLQSYNRYTYVNNNPLSYTDPSGFFLKKLFNKARAFIKSYWRPILAIAVAAFGQYYLVAPLTGGSAIAMSMAVGAVSGAIAGGSQGALWGALGGYVFGSIGQVGFENLAAKAFAHGIGGGILSRAQGENFGVGFVAAFATAGSSKSIREMGGTDLWGTVQRTMAAAVVGGTAAVIGGGKFRNGAVTGAFSWLFNSERGARAEQRISDDWSEVIHYIDEQIKADPGGEVVLSNKQFDAVALRDAYVTKNNGFDGMDVIEFNSQVRGYNGTFFRYPAVKFSLAIDGVKVTMLGSDINYYMQGFATAAAGSPGSNLNNERIALYNYGQSWRGALWFNWRSSIHNFNQIQNGKIMAAWGEKYYMQNQANIPDNTKIIQIRNGIMLVLMCLMLAACGGNKCKRLQGRVEDESVQRYVLQWVDENLRQPEQVSFVLPHPGGPWNVGLPHRGFDWNRLGIQSNETIQLFSRDLDESGFVYFGEGARYGVFVSIEADAQQELNDERFRNLPGRIVSSSGRFFVYCAPGD